MPIKKWIVQCLITWPLVFILLAGVQYLKGRGLDYSIEFGFLWAIIFVAIFAATRVYYFRKGLYCKVCNDLPQDKQNAKK